jgi:hypothetical protein
MLTQVPAMMEINDLPQYMIELSADRGYEPITMTECFYIFEKVMLRRGITLEQKTILDSLMEIPGNFKIDIQKVLKELGITAFGHDSSHLKQMLIEKEYLPKDYKYTDTDNGKIFKVSYKSCMVKKIGKRIAYMVGIVDLCVILCRIDGTDPFVRYFSLHDKITHLYETYRTNLDIVNIQLDINEKNAKSIVKLTKVLNEVDTKLRTVNDQIEEYSKKNKDIEESINSKTIVPDELKRSIIINERRFKQKKKTLKILKDYYNSKTA